jgi:hypothetical protein
MINYRSYREIIHNMVLRNKTVRHLGSTALRHFDISALRQAQCPAGSVPGVPVVEPVENTGG